jgi:hypothetical protein
LSRRFALCFIVPEPVSGVCADEVDQRHQFSSYSNWIIPGFVMLGRYPFLEPTHCTKRDIGEKQLQQILSAGITTFVSLETNLPPQQEMPACGVDGFLPYKATADLIAAGTFVCLCAYALVNFFSHLRVITPRQKATADLMDFIAGGRPVSV